MAILSGIDRLLLFRIDGDTSQNAWKVPYQTEHDFSESRDFEVTETKDGSVSSAGAYEGTISLTALAKQGGETIQQLKEVLRERNPRKVKVWEIEVVDVDEETTTIPGEYMLCNLTDLSSTAPTDGNVEITLDFTVEGRPQVGDVNVTPQLLAIIQQASDEQDFVQPMVAEEGK